VNGQTNFTQQFALNGQRGVEAVFAMDGADVSDPEMGGEHVHEFRRGRDSGITVKLGLDAGGHRARCGGLYQYRDRSGKNGFHGSFFEFLRNSALDARNYFDHPSIAEPGRIPSIP